MGVWRGEEKKANRNREREWGREAIHSLVVPRIYIYIYMYICI
jgi:hypothetical protein